MSRAQVSNEKICNRPNSLKTLKSVPSTVVPIFQCPYSFSNKSNMYLILKKLFAFKFKFKSLAQIFI